ncbi:MAG: hypothetical protein ABEK10_01950 [Candidatus Nanosalina sp.]
MNLRETVNSYRWRIAFTAALLNDSLDLIGIGTVPLIGDALDAATSLIIWKLTGEKKVAAALIEFMPGADIIPLYTATVAYAYYKNLEKDG